jgi:excisionase family DNA binding protein
MAEKRTLEEQLSPETIAERINVDVSTVRRWIKQGKLGPPRKLGRRIVRIPASAVNAFLESRAV